MPRNTPRDPAPSFPALSAPFPADHEPPHEPHRDFSEPAPFDESAPPDETVSDAAAGAPTWWSGYHEPGPDQRWSTWASATPLERGPQPHPDWLETASAAFDTELGILKTGKEADVYLIERAVPGQPGCTLAAKRYRGREHSTFHRSGQYQEGRGFRRSRDQRAVAKKSSYGRLVAAGHWAAAEFEALSRAYQAQIPVPYPVQLSGTEVLMEFIGDGREAAPRLAQARLVGPELQSAFEQVREILEAFARGGLAHGDLSPYNLLWHRGSVIVIDLPQVVDLAANPAGFEFLQRDVVNVCTWFHRGGVDCDADARFGVVAAQSR